MTITEYFAQEQPVSTEIINEIYYKDVQEIVFGDETRYIKIKVVHVGENLWSFGWEIKDGDYNPIACHECSPRAITTGEIHLLVYGMTKVIQKHLDDILFHTRLIAQLVNEAIAEASLHCVFKTSYDNKITI